MRKTHGAVTVFVVTGSTAAVGVVADGLLLDSAAVDVAAAHGGLAVGVVADSLVAIFWWSTCRQCAINCV